MGFGMSSSIADESMIRECAKALESAPTLQFEHRFCSLRLQFSSTHPLPRSWREQGLPVLCMCPIFGVYG